MTWHPDMPPEFMNQIVTGDAMELSARIPDESIDLVVIDPPYNAGKDYGDTSDDDLPHDEYLEWYRSICRESYRVMRNGYLYVSCTTSQLWDLKPTWEEAGFGFQCMLIWHGPNYASNSNQIRSQWRVLYEPVLMFLKGDRLPMLNEVHGYNTDAVMRYTRPQRDYKGELKRVHPAQKPLDLYVNVIARTPGQVVLDWFAGSGTVAMAAKKLRRDFVAFEINPRFAKDARRRVEEIHPLPEFFTPDAEQLEMFEASGV